VLMPSANVDYRRARFEIVGNRLLAKNMRPGWGLLLNFKTESPNAVPQSFRLKDNVISNPYGDGGNGDLMIKYEHAQPPAFTSDSGGNHVYSCAAPIELKGLLDCSSNPKVELPDLPTRAEDGETSG